MAEVSQTRSDICNWENITSAVSSAVNNLAIEESDRSGDRKWTFTCSNNISTDFKIHQKAPKNQMTLTYE